MADVGEIRRDKGTGEEPHWIESQQRWRARYVDADGKRRSVYSRLPDKPGWRACKKARDEKLDAVRQGLDVGLATQRLEDYLTGWLRTRQRELRPRSYEKYAGKVDKYLIPHLGTVKIGELRTSRITRLYDELTESGLSPANIAYTHAVLHKALSDAVKRRIIGRNPADHAGAPRATSGEIQPFTPAEVETLLAGIGGKPLEVLIILALRTAMRLSELLGLRWSDVAKTELHVSREMYRHGTEWITDTPKSKKARNIAITADTFEMLRLYRLERAKVLLSIGHRLTDSDPIFLLDTGEPFDGRHLTERRFRPLLKELGLPERKFHTLRHTAATLMLAAGVHPKVVQEMLGHADVQQTLNRYSHVLPTMQTEAARALEAVTRRAAR